MVTRFLRRFKSTPLALSVVCLLSAPGHAQEDGKCPHLSGWQPTKQELAETLRAHKEWVESWGRLDTVMGSTTPGRARLCGANLRGVDLSGVDLSGADLRRADLSKANLSKSALYEANLRGADLSGANLRGATLWGANLIRTDLEGADLSKVYMHGANLRNANLYGANLSEVQLESGNLNEASLTRANLRAARLKGAKLRGANMYAADLSLADLSNADLGPSEHRRGTGRGALLSEADLSGAKLNWANLTETDLTRANLDGAALRGAILQNADLTRSNLRGADLAWANLSEATLVDTVLTDTIFTRVTLTGALYEPASAPKKGTIGEISGLLDVRFSAGKHSGLVMLRGAFRDVGLRQLEREATYLIEHGKTNFAPGIERWLKRAMFEWTSDYGMSPGRPLRILLALMFLFSFPYMLSVVGSTDTTSGIWRVWREDRVEKQSGEDTPQRIEVTGYLVLLWGLYFSLLSAFHVGWRDLNVGNWIARINPQEYNLRATGWVKVVSGIQSLISVYLIALSALTYFGRPFQ